jgi:hypothetical protein
LDEEKKLIINDSTDNNITLKDEHVFDDDELEIYQSKNFSKRNKKKINKTSLLIILNN